MEAGGGPRAGAVRVRWRMGRIAMQRQQGWHWVKEKACRSVARTGRSIGADMQEERVKEFCKKNE